MPTLYLFMPTMFAQIAHCSWSVTHSSTAMPSAESSMMREGDIFRHLQRCESVSSSALITEQCHADIGYTGPRFDHSWSGWLVFELERGTCGETRRRRRTLFATLNELDRIDIPFTAQVPEKKT